MWNDQQLDEVRNIAVAAGQEILTVYDQDQELEITLKDDKSPLTEADRRAHELIVDDCKDLTLTYPFSRKSQMQSISRLAVAGTGIGWSIRLTAPRSSSSVMASLLSISR